MVDAQSRASDGIQDGTSGKYAGQITVFDKIGQVEDSSKVLPINGNWTTQTEPFQTTAQEFIDTFTHLTRDELSRLKLVELPDGNTRQFNYAGCGCAGNAQTTVTDELGHSTQTKSDALGRMVEAIEFNNGLTNGGVYSKAEYFYDALDRLVEIRHSENSGSKIQYRYFSYDGYGRLASETTPEGGTVNYTYTANDQVWQVSNQRNITAAYTYNTRNLPANVSYSDGTPTVVYSYDAYGARSSVTDGEGQTSYTYNSYRQLQSEQRTFTGLANRFHTLNYAYNLADQVRQVNYQVTEQTGFVPVAKDPVQIAQQIQPEPMPQVSRPGQTAQPEQPARTTAKRRTAQAMMSNRSITGIVRHAATNQGIGGATVTANRLDDPQQGPNPSVQTSSNSQSLGYFMVEDLPDGATYRLTVSKNGYVFLPSEVDFEMTEDKQQDFTGLEYPPTGTLSASPNPIQVCDSSGQGAPTLTWSATGVTAVQIRRGAPNGPLVGSGGTSGSAIANQTTNGTVFYLQNVTGGLPLTSANTLTTATVTITQQGCPVFSGVFNKTINYAYNSVGALSSVGTDLIAGASDTNSTNVLNTLSFRSSGALSSVHYGNGRRLQMGYNDDRSQPISMKVDRVTNSADKIIDYQYDYYDAQGNNNNRIRKITDNIDPQYTTTYSYDGYNRLKEANWSGDGRFYQYDEWGNIKSVNFGLTYNYATSGNGAPATNRLESVALDGVTQTTYSYDAAGNTVSGEGKTFAYDAVNRLKSVNSGTSTYGYDGDGKRVRVTDGGASVFYIYSSALGQSVMEVTQAGVQRAYVYNGTKVVAMQATDGQFYWLHTNHLGNSRAMTDANGNLAYKGHFDPFGQMLNEWSSSGNNNLNLKKFTGYERDIVTGLDYAQVRMYNSAKGRFTKPDPRGLKAANLKRPQSLNRYAYVENDPVNYADPTGTTGIPVSTLQALEWWIQNRTVQVTATVSGPISGGIGLDGYFLPEEGPVDSGGGGEGGGPDDQQLLVIRAYLQSLSIFGNKNSCSDFFGGNLAALQHILGELGPMLVGAVGTLNDRRDTGIQMNVPDTANRKKQWR